MTCEAEKTQISLRIRSVWLVFPVRCMDSQGPKLIGVDGGDSDQSLRMRRLTWDLARCTHFVGIAVDWHESNELTLVMLNKLSCNTHF